MNRQMIGFLAAAYLAIAGVATAYIAGCAYFIASKTVPHDIAIDTWYRYWDAYANDPVQRQRLLTAAAAAFITVLGAPLIAILALAREGRRSLHGDARWASHAEIRKAGLL